MKKNELISAESTQIYEEAHKYNDDFNSTAEKSFDSQTTS